MGKAQSLIYFAISRLNAELDVWVVNEAQGMTHNFVHGNDLGAGVKDRFNILIVVDQR